MSAPKKGKSRRVAEPRNAASWSAPEAPAKRAKLFWNGRSQAVRLPKEFRFEGDEVAIRREGDRVILEPARPARGWPPGYWERLREYARTFRFPDVPPLFAGPERESLDPE
jgi:hypothetical protein